jgi:hypothetical protein
VDGIQQVGFACAVIARKSIYAVAQFQIGLGVIFKIDER